MESIKGMKWRDVRKRINQQIREYVSAGAMYAEVGFRCRDDGEDTINSLEWTEDADLADIHMLRDIKGVDLKDERCVLDLYVYGKTDFDGDSELITNLTADIFVVEDGEVKVAVSAHYFDVVCAKPPGS